jgi:hypothetical protein
MVLWSEVGLFEFSRSNITTLIATISCHIQVTFQKLNTANSGESITLMVIVTCHSPIFQPWFLCVYHSLVDSNENSICSIVSIIFCYCSLISLTTIVLTLLWSLTKLLSRKQSLLKLKSNFKFNSENSSKLVSWNPSIVCCEWSCCCNL